MKTLLNIQKYTIDKPIPSMITRQASRAIIYNGTDLVMIQSNKYGEYKFPGGGVHVGESPVEALKREIREETGLIEVYDIKEYGRVIESRKANDPGIDVFMMESFYYFVTVGTLQMNQQLDPYEQEYGYLVKHVSIEDAIQKNKTLFGNKNVPWVERETAVLELLLQNNEAN